jgi:hypothetical protein
MKPSSALSSILRSGISFFFIALPGPASYDEQMGTNPLCYLDGADWYCVMRLVGARLPSAAMPAFVKNP